MVIQKNDFIAFEFIASIKGGDVFDTNIEEEAKKLGMKDKVKPSIICIGHSMVVSGLDKELEGKELDKEYEIELKPENAFGNRDSSLIRTYPLKAFLSRNINPQPGMMLALDNSLAKVVSVSGGRVIIDLNNPMAGKNIIYKFKILNQLEKIEEKASALKDYFYGPQVSFELLGNRIIIKAPKEAEKFIMIYKDKFKEMLNLELEFQEAEKEEKKEEKKEEEKKEEEAEKREEKKEEEKKEEKTEKETSSN